LKKNYYENQFFKKDNFKSNFVKRQSTKNRHISDSDLVKELFALKFKIIEPNIFVKLNVQITFLEKTIRIESFMKNIDFEETVNFMQSSFKDYFLNVNNQRYFHIDFLKTL
jgi:hypothetical protein